LGDWGFGVRKQKEKTDVMAVQAMLFERYENYYYSMKHRYSNQHEEI
jgi:hypothetical protein